MLAWGMDILVVDTADWQRFHRGVDAGTVYRRHRRYGRVQRVIPSIPLSAWGSGS